MMRVNPSVLEFIDNWVTKEIVDKYGFSEEVALEKFIFSQTYKMLNDYKTALYLDSPQIIFDLWESEQVTGDPHNSVYIRENVQ